MLLPVFLGRITTRTSLDRRLQDLHMVRVSAVDGGGHAGYAVVRVYVTAEPSAMPTFLMTEYRANVFADVATATSVLKVRCRYVVESLHVTALLSSPEESVLPVLILLPHFTVVQELF